MTFTSRKVPTGLLEMGIPDIDDQHRTLFIRIDDLRTTVLCHAPTAEIAAAADRLDAFAREHFAYEERLMSDIGFADHAAHAAEHATLLNDLAAFRERAAHGDVTPELPRLMRSWIIEHLVQFDRQYSDYLLDDESGE
jgi:hemerythrin